MSGASLFSSSRRLALALGVGVIVIAITITFALQGDPSHLDRARAEVANREAFRGATTAGEALLRASIELQAAGHDCGGDGSRCDRLLTASAMARVSSINVLSCRRPDIHRFREAFAGYLDDLDAGRDPAPPPPPVCD